VIGTGARDILLAITIILCLITAACSTKPSDPSTGGPGPAIFTEPTDQTVTVGQTATFSVVATGPAPISYQWQKNGVNVGGNSASYTTPATTSADNGSKIIVVVSNPNGSLPSTTAMLTVNLAPVAPSITAQPLSQTVTAGQTAIFTVTATGTAPLSYQWQNAATNTNVAGATSSSYSIANTTTAESGTQLRVVVSNGVNPAATSNTVTLTVNAVAVAPTISVQPISQIVTAGQTAMFSVSATGTAPLSYQWQNAATNTNIAGATSSSYSIMNTTTAESGTQLRVVVSNGVNPAATSNTVTLTVNPAQGQLITLSTNGKYLVSGITGKPVFLVGDDAFDLAVMLDSADVTTYLSDRASRGFNAIWVTTVDNGYQTNPPMNFFGASPFDGPDFTNEDPTYWANVDSVVTQASNLGITVFLQPFFVGNGSEAGYQTSLLAASAATLQSYGTFLGNRYKGYNNIVWLLGGDSIPSHGGVYSQLNILGAAIAAADPNHLMTLEGCQQCATNGYNSVAAFQAAGLAVPSWLSLNWAYPQYTTTVAASQNAYTQTPFLPPLAGENFYELTAGFTEAQLRFEIWSEVLSGTYLGRIFGNGAIWNFNSPIANGGFGPSPTWQSQLGSAGSVAQALQGGVFSSREHWLLVPDINHTVVTAGYGSGTSITTTARTSDGQTIISYIPNGNATMITVAMSQITSSTSTVRGWWFNPTTGATTSLGVFTNSGTQTFTAPDANDWVLVLDDASANLPAP
jgi:hypothetical protein